MADNKALKEIKEDITVYIDNIKRVVDKALEASPQGTTIYIAREVSDTVKESLEEDYPGFEFTYENKQGLHIKRK